MYKNDLYYFRSRCFLEGYQADMILCNIMVNKEIMVRLKSGIPR